MGLLPSLDISDQTISLMFNKWKSILDPIIKLPTNNSNLLRGIKLVTGTNSVNHLLGRNLQGWALVRVRAAGSIYDSQDANPTPNLTLQLVATGNVVVDILVF